MGHEGKSIGLVSFWLRFKSWSPLLLGLPWWLSSKEPACNAGDPGSIPGLARWGQHNNLLHYSSLENSMDRGTWRASVHRAAQSWTWLKQLSSSSSPHFQSNDFNKGFNLSEPWFFFPRVCVITPILNVKIKLITQGSWHKVLLLLSHFSRVQLCATP